MKTRIKLSVTIEQERINHKNISGEMVVADILFSDFDRLLDAEDIVNDVKYALRMLKGFKMLTIDLTDGEQFTSYPELIQAVRFTNHYGEIKMATANRDDKCFTQWEKATANYVYSAIRSMAHIANTRHTNKLSKNNNTEVATAI